ncbi:MAG: hypothetical protein V3U84_00685 [Thiotrichaceae bacterium]
MRKGRLEKTKNYPKNSVDWERFSFRNGVAIKTRAYLDAHDMTTYCGIAEDNNYHTSFKRGFKTIEEAFEWADNKVDYKTGTIRA